MMASDAHHGPIPLPFLSMNEPGKPTPLDLR